MGILQSIFGNVNLFPGSPAGVFQTIALDDLLTKGKAAYDAGVAVIGTPAGPARPSVPKQETPKAAASGMSRIVIIGAVVGVVGLVWYFSRRKK